MKPDYRKTLRACYLGFVTQAIAANFAPLLFLRFRETYAITLGQLALIPVVFFLTQLLVDLLCAGMADKIGYRRAVVASEILSAAGLAGLAVLPELFRDAFAGLLISVVIYAIGSGLIEVLVSPIVEACPFEHKEAVMSTLHSFYCWGSAGVIALSSLFFYVFGTDKWKLLACLWALVPLYNVFNFASCPIVPIIREGKGMGIRKLLVERVFLVGCVLMVCAGASELSMAQWASVFAESALQMSKAAGDLIGPCLFAVTMGLSRVVYGRGAARMDLKKYMLLSGLCCLCCYLLTSLCAHPALKLAGCVLCGFSVGIMWPGTISILSARLPLGGTAMFALLAMAGDLGGAAGPGLVGITAQALSDDLSAGLGAACVFPAVLILCVLWLKRAKGKRNENVDRTV